MCTPAHDDFVNFDQTRRRLYPRIRVAVVPGGARRHSPIRGRSLAQLERVAERSRRSRAARPARPRRPRAHGSRRRRRPSARRRPGRPPASRSRSRRRAATPGAAARARSASPASDEESPERAPVVPVTRDEVEPAVRLARPRAAGARRSRSARRAGRAAAPGRSPAGRSATIRLVAPAERASAAKRSQPYASSSDEYVIGTSGTSDALAGRGEALEAGLRPHALRERLLGGAADHRAVGERVGEREAELDEVGAALDGRLGQLRRLRPGHQVDRERLAHSSRARTSARSLSPRPERQTTTSSASSSSTRASACDGSSAGMIPSVRVSRRNASSASSSVVPT